MVIPGWKDLGMFLFSLLDFPVLFEFCISMSYLFSGKGVVSV